jgi:hypothetical protein
VLAIEISALCYALKTLIREDEMGNSDSMGSAFSAHGTNKVVDFDGGYFSFAFGNEIAMVINEQDGYFILNCGAELFNEVKEKVADGLPKEELIKFWKDKSSDYEISDWSASFEELSA